MRKLVYSPMDVSWMPCGRQPIAVHHATGRIYVMMHKGEYWSMYDGRGNLGSGRQHPQIDHRNGLSSELKGKWSNIAVSQDSGRTGLMSAAAAG